MGTSHLDALVAALLLPCSPNSDAALLHDQTLAGAQDRSSGGPRTSGPRSASCTEEGQGRRGVGATGAGHQSMEKGGEGLVRHLREVEREEGGAGIAQGGAGVVWRACR
jgi:hypothetical protein